MTRSLINSQWPRREQFSGPWSVNPWMNPQNTGPRAAHGATALPMYALPPEPFGLALPFNLGTGQEQRRKEYREQRAKLEWWDAEDAKTTLR